QWRLFALLVVAQSLTSLFAFLRSVLTAKQLFKIDSFFSVLDKALLLLFCIGPVYGLFFHITILHFLALQVLSTSVAVITLGLVLLREKLFTAGEKVNIKIIASWTAPFVLIILLMSVHNRLDAFLLERMHADGALQAGIYAMAYRLLDAANMIGYLTALFLVPFVARHANNTKLVQQVLLFSRHGLLLLSAAAVAFVIVFAPWLMKVLYHTSSFSGIVVMRLCLAVLPAYFLTHVYGSALTATAHFKVFIRLLFLAVFVNVLLNLWLIPLYGAEGCCIAALISQYTCGIALWFSASRKLKIASGKSSALLYPAVAVCCGALFYFAQKLTGNVWIILSSIALLGFVLLLTQRSQLKKLILSD
ncbi:MAG TPA: polysaccharide biosynthesis C-terminal domain-containing protein, partial [Flavisolibacter sp.]|nr:polysaccharide biosynthesis C-terminal domain-containing protein [Flavisolibacter sp.]